MTSKREAKGINLVVQGCVKPLAPNFWMAQPVLEGAALFPPIRFGDAPKA